MRLFWFIICYIAASVVVYTISAIRCRKNPIFKAPRSPTIYYLISFTWGLPSVIFGGIVSAVLFLYGKRPKKYGNEWCFEIPNINSGIELGLFFVVPEGGTESLKMHEHGHGIQNLYFGIFNPLVVSIPSLTRFWYRKFRKAIGKPCKTEHDDIWFEKSASLSGNIFIHKRNFSGNG